MFQAVHDKCTTRRFQIFVPLCGGYEGKVTTSLEEVKELVFKWVSSKLQKKERYLSGFVYPVGSGIFGWRTGDAPEDFTVLEEPNVVVDISTHPEFHRDFSAEDIDRVIQELSSHIGEACGQTRIYVHEMQTALTIFQRPKSVAPTQTHQQ